MLEAMWRVLAELAPWMLLGMAIAGLMHGLLPRGLVRRRLAGRAGVLRAVLLGVPLPLCSCGVIPAGLGLKRSGASDGASIGFLISTPQTGVDSVLVTSSFLGWPFALFKVLSAAVTGVAGGWLVDAASAPATARGAEDGALAAPARRDLRGMLDHGLDILRTIWGWLVLGIVASAAIEVFLPRGWLEGVATWGPAAAALAALALSLPLYVCATASVPIAAALVAGGLPAGAALVFLMAGPATNVATIGAVYKAFGGRTLGIYLAVIVAGSAGFGLVFDFLLPPAAVVAGHAHGAPAWWAVASAGLLSALIAWFAAEEVRSRLARGRGRGARAGSIELGVGGMECAGCASKLERALRQEQGVTAVRVSLEPGRAVVSGSIDEGRLRSAIERAGFVPS